MFKEKKGFTLIELLVITGISPVKPGAITGITPIFSIVRLSGRNGSRMAAVQLIREIQQIRKLLIIIIN